MENGEQKYESLLFTGGCGFIGSNVLLYLLKSNPGMKILNVDRMSYCSREPDIPIEYQSRYTFERVDITDSKKILDLLKSHQVDSVIHMAAQTHVDLSFGNSMEFTKDNILGTHCLLEACRYYGKIKRFVHVSTDECYGEVDDDHAGCKEHEAYLNPTNPYAATKVGAEYLVKSYGHSFNFPYIITRGNNVYGPQQYPDKIIPLFTKLLRNGQQCTIHGKGTARRNFIHVNDVCRAFHIILHKGKLREIYNIGTNDEYSVMDIAKMLINIVHPNDPLDKHIRYVPDRDFNDHRYAIDVSALQALGWKKEIDFHDGLRQTVRWYDNNKSYWKPKAKHFLLYGAKGWIGQKLHKILVDTPGIICTLGEARTDNYESVKAEIHRVNPTHVMSVIGRTHGPGCGTIDWLEAPGRLVDNIRDNLFAPLNLANICREMNIHLTYMGTGCIFKYEGNKLFTEDDLPNFFGSSYSIVKGFTDRVMKQYEDHVMNCRIRMPISSDDSPRNFITKITTYEKICSIPNSMTVLEEILPIIVQFACKNKTGTYNMTNPGVISHNEILDMYTEIIDPAFTYKNFNEEEMRKILKSDRSNNHLDTTKLEREHPSIRPIKDAVRETLLEMKINRGWVDENKCCNSFKGCKKSHTDIDEKEEELCN